MFSLFRKRPDSICYYLSFTRSFAFTKNFLEYCTDFLKKHNLPVSVYYAINKKYNEFRGDLSNTGRLPISEIVMISIYDEKEPPMTYFMSDIQARTNIIFLEFSSNYTVSFEEFLLSFKDLKPEYGFSYFGIIGKMGSSYIMGDIGRRKYIFGIGKNALSDYKTWMKQYNHMHTGLLRDVFINNVLCQKHVDQVCTDGITLKNKITSDNRLGSVKQIEEDLYLWTIPEENLGYARNTFYSERFII